jgi:hypothetical protein
MDESMVLSKAAVTRPHPESFAGAKSEKKYNMMCGANSVATNASSPPPRPLITTKAPLTNIHYELRHGQI